MLLYSNIKLGAEGTMGGRGRGRTRAGEGRRYAAWITIAALVLQLVVSAWHVHPEDFARLAAATSGNPDHASSSTTQPGAPGHEDCALCFTLHLAMGSGLPDAGAVALPAAAKAPPLAMPAALHLASAPYLLFRTRAPPATA
jgi:hypothetical protein